MREAEGTDKEALEKKGKRYGEGWRVKTKERLVSILSEEEEKEDSEDRLVL